MWNVNNLHVFGMLFADGFEEPALLMFRVFFNASELFIKKHSRNAIFYWLSSVAGRVGGPPKYKPLGNFEFATSPAVRILPSICYRKTLTIVIYEIVIHIKLKHEHFK